MKGISLPEKWVWKKAQECMDVRDGTHDSPKYISEGYPLVTSKNLINGKIDFSSCSYISKEAHEAISKRSAVDDGDILYAMIGTIGNPVIVKKQQEFSIKNVALFKFPYQTILNKYVYYFLESDLATRQFNSNSRGGTQKFVSLKNIRELKIPLPPLAEQKQIAAILDAADSLRQKDQQLVEHYTSLSQSLFLKMFGDLKGEKVPLSSLCKINPPKSEIAKLDKNSYVSFVPMAKVSEYGEVDLSDERILKEVWSGFTYFAENDVVFAKITPCMENGKGAILRGLLNGVGFGTTEFHVLRPIKHISTPEWLYSLTTQKFFRQNAELNMTGSAGQKRVPKQFFDKYMVVQPKIELQNQFVERVSIIEQQKQQAQANLEKSEALFNSLLQRAFTGELTANKAA